MKEIFLQKIQTFPLTFLWGNYTIASRNDLGFPLLTIRNEINKIVVTRVVKYFDKFAHLKIICNAIPLIQTSP